MNKIPVGQTIASAYRFTFVGLERIIGVIWLPIIILTIGDYFVSGQYLTGMATAMESDDPTQALPMLTAVIGYGFVKLLLVSVIGVGITREILKPLNRPMFLRFSFGGAELRMAVAVIGLYALLFVVALICLTAGSFLAGAAGAAPGMAAGAKVVGFAAALALLFSPILIYAFARLSYLVVPSVVLDGKFGIERSWQLAKGNVGRIVLIALAIVIPLLIVQAVLQAVVMGPDSLSGEMDFFSNRAAQARQTAEQMRQVAAHLPLLMGIKFVLAPFFYGLIFAAPAFAFQALTAAPSNGSQQ